MAVTQLLERSEKEGETFLNSIVTDGEMLVHYLTPEFKKASMQCQQESSTPPIQVKNAFRRRDHVYRILEFKEHYLPGLSHCSK